MSQSQKSYLHIEQSIQEWALKRQDVRSVFIVGSRGRKNQSDIRSGSDLDVIVITDKPKTYSDASWMEEIDSVVISQRKPEQHMVFHHSNDFYAIYKPALGVDFSVVHSSTLRNQLFTLPISRRLPLLVSDLLKQQMSSLIIAFHFGYKVIVDKDGLAEALDKTLVSLPQPDRAVSESEFSELLNSFIIYGFRCAQKIQSEHLYTAKWICDVTMKTLLVQMLEWHTASKTDSHQEEWLRDLCVDDWADNRVLQEMPELFPQYNAPSILASLSKMIDLAYWVSAEVSTQMKHNDSFMKSIDHFEWLKQYLENQKSSRS